MGWGVGWWWGGTKAGQSQRRMTRAGPPEIRFSQVGGGLEEKMALRRPLKEEPESTGKESKKGIYGRGTSVNSGLDIQ